jgi:hypothetical protein
MGRVGGAAGAGLQEGENGLQFFRLHVVGVGGHVVTAVGDADDHLVAIEPVGDGAEIRAADSALAVYRVTVEARFRVEELGTVDDRWILGADDRGGKRWSVEPWSPGSLHRQSP